MKASILRASASFFVATAIAYVVVMAAAGVNTPSEVLEFIAASSHGIRTSGLARMVFGFPRSFIHMGNDGFSSNDFS